MNGTVQHLNPDGLMKNPAFSQVITTQGNGKTIYIGGQNAVNAAREIIGKGNLQAQTEQVMQNILIALEASGASFENVVKLSIHIAQGQNPVGAFQASQKFLNNLANPPVITVLIVVGFANPDFLIEIDLVAFVPE